MKYDVKGKSTEDILGLDFEEINKLKRSDLALITSRLNSTANKRLKRLEEKGYDVSKYEKFSVKNKSTNELRNELKRVKNFLNMETSSLRKRKKIERKTAKRLEISVSKNKDFWKAYEEFYDKNYALMESVKNGSDRVIEIIKEEMIENERPKKEVFKEIMKDLQNQYEKEFKEWEEEYVDEIDISEFF